MTTPVSIHPYFRVHEGKIDAFRALFPEFVARTQGESKCLEYGFTVNGDVVFCRESYEDADGALHHLENVGDLLEQALAISDLERLEFHGPEAELDRIRPKVAALPAEFFVHETGVRR